MPGRAMPQTLEVRDIVKRYPGAVANDGVSLVVRAGEVHCVLGENGAGKSTLMHILSGLRQPDSGSLFVDGAPVSIDSPRAAIRLGIGAVYQHPTSAAALTVVENMMLGEGHAIRLDVQAAREALAHYGGMLGVEFDPDAQVGRLALGRRQQMEIAKALWSGSRFLILDEPTAMLTPQGVEELADVLRRLKASDIAVVLVTHKLAEALATGDRITVLRRGRVTGTWGRQEMQTAGPKATYRAIVAAMFGEAVGEEAGRATEQPRARPSVGRGKPDLPSVLEVESLSVAPGRGEIGVSDFTLTVRAGEIVGVAGIDGNGQRELAEALAGQRSAASGDIRVGGVSVIREGVSGRTRRGLRYVTDDRTGEGTVASLSVALNLLLKRIGERPFWRHGRADAESIDRHAEDLIGRFDILAPGVSTPCGDLSGGNLQKVVLARELSSDPAVVVYNKPTYGLDLVTTAAVRRRIRELAAAGVGALLISADLEEVLELSDRVAVMSGGDLVGVVDNGPEAESAVSGLMLGGGGP